MTSPRTGSRPPDPDERLLPPEGEGEASHVWRALRTLSAGNRTLLRAADESELVKAMCRVIVEEGGYRLAGVLSVIHDEPRTLHLAALAVAADADPTVERVLRAMFFSWGDNEFGQHPSGVAVRTGQPCIGRNLLDDPTMPAEHMEVRQFGCASISAFPLCIDGR